MNGIYPSVGRISEAIVFRVLPTTEIHRRLIILPNNNNPSYLEIDAHREAFPYVLVSPIYEIISLERGCQLMFTCFEPGYKGIP